MLPTHTDKQRLALGLLESSVAGADMSCSINYSYSLGTLNRYSKNNPPEVLFLQ